MLTVSCASFLTYQNLGHFKTFLLQIQPSTLAKSSMFDYPYKNMRCRQKKNKLVTAFGASHFKCGLAIVGQSINFMDKLMKLVVTNLHSLFQECSAQSIAVICNWSRSAIRFSTAVSRGCMKFKRLA